MRQFRRRFRCLRKGHFHVLRLTRDGGTRDVCQRCGAVREATHEPEAHTAVVSMPRAESATSLDAPLLEEEVEEDAGLDGGDWRNVNGTEAVPLSAEDLAGIRAYVRALDASPPARGSSPLRTPWSPGMVWRRLVVGLRRAEHP